MICVECGSDVKSLYREYSKGNIRLTHCPSCHELADRYVELEPHIVFIDLILHKAQAYRHILFNRPVTRFKDVCKFLIVIFAFDSFDRWFLSQSLSDLPDNPWEGFSMWLRPHDNQWLIPITAILETVIYFGGICLFTRILFNSNKLIDFRLLISALVLSCFSKLGILLWMVWDAQVLHRKTISLFTITSNILALKVSLRSGTWFKPISIIVISLMARYSISLIFSYLEPSLVLKIL